jgi:hypothetical protein
MNRPSAVRVPASLGEVGEALGRHAGNQAAFLRIAEKLRGRVVRPPSPTSMVWPPTLARSPMPAP